MRTIALLFLALLSTLSFAHEKIELITFNTGFAKAKIFNLVACTKARTKLFEMVLDQRMSISNSKTVYLFQELFTKKSFEALQRLGKKYNYNLHPKSFKQAKKSGIVTFTNIDVTSARWIPFRKSKYPGIKRGVQIVSITDRYGKIVDIMNTHTAYSGKKAPDRAHVSQLKQLTEEIQHRQKNEHSIILAGDFNIGDDYRVTNQRYDLVETIWSPFISALNLENIFEAKQPNPTWDQENNPLVYKPSFFIRTFVSRRWEEQTSTIDHIFTSADIVMENTGLVFDSPISPKGQCRGEANFLSDHYGVISTLNLEKFNYFKAL
jgi:endonuclease/exonuclease/phosphatase family metal-dependent hydrolase